MEIKKVSKKAKKELKGFTRGFKKFIARGNIIDLAVALVIGGAFGKIVTSFVNDIILPPIGLVLGGVKFSELSAHIGNNVYINYGNFIQMIIEFIVISFAIYLGFYFVFRKRRIEENLKKQQPVAVPADIQLLTEIRDLLKEEKTEENILGDE